jgi:hypothetical protein
MRDTQSAYQFYMVFTPPIGEPPITQSLSAINTLLLDAIRRADRHVGRPTIPREAKLRNLLRARDQLRQRGEVTEEAMGDEMGVSDRTIRKWLTDDLKLT